MPGRVTLTLTLILALTLALALALALALTLAVTHTHTLTLAPTVSLMSGRGSSVAATKSATDTSASITQTLPIAPRSSTSEIRRPASSPAAEGSASLYINVPRVPVVRVSCKSGKLWGAEDGGSEGGGEGGDEGGGGLVNRGGGVERHASLLKLLEF